MAVHVSRPQTAKGQKHDIERDQGPFGPDFREPTQKELQMQGDRPFMVARPLPEDRWPRGFTPGRKREVEEALPDVSFTEFPAGELPPKEYRDPVMVAMQRDMVSSPADTERVHIRHYSDFIRDHRRAFNNGRVDSPIPIHSPRALLALGALARSSLVDTLSRSTASPAYISGTGTFGKIRKFSADFILPPELQESAERENWTGLYRGDISTGLSDVLIRYPQRSNNSQQNVLHELGHANDPSLGFITEEPEASADAEGFAEGYTYKNLRLDPRDKSDFLPSNYLGAPYGDIRDNKVDIYKEWGSSTPDFIRAYHRGYGDEASHARYWRLGYTPSDEPLFADENDNHTDQPTHTKRVKQDFEVMQLPGLEDDSNKPHVSAAMRGPQFSRPAHQSTVNPLKGYVDPTHQAPMFPA